MPVTTVDDIAIHFEVSGPPDGRPLMLIGGFGTQLIEWREPLCELLIAGGFRVIRMDSRDVGLSQRFGADDDVDGGYDLADMAADIVRVLDTLGIAAAHLVGHSMGGMMAQVVAIGSPDRVLSLTLIGTLPGQDPSHLNPAAPGFDVSVPLPSLPREVAIEQFVEGQRFFQAPGFPFDEAEQREHAARQIDRAYAPAGLNRQWAGETRATDRLEALGSVTVPTVLIHGRDDRSVDWSASLAMAQVMPQAELLVYAGLGHQIERGLWPEFVAAIVRVASRAEALA